MTKLDTPKILSLDDLLDAISVGDVDDYHIQVNPDVASLKGWYYVCVDQGLQGGVIAYFLREADAFSYRLNLINAQLNDIRIEEQ